MPPAQRHDVGGGRMMTKREIAEVSGLGVEGVRQRVLSGVTGPALLSPSGTTFAGHRADRACTALGYIRPGRGRPSGMEELPRQETLDLARTIARTWHSAEPKRGRLRTSLLVHARAVIRLLQDGGRMTHLVSALDSLGVLQDRGHALGVSGFRSIWMSIERRLARRRQEQDAA